MKYNVIVIGSSDSDPYDGMKVTDTDESQEFDLKRATEIRDHKQATQGGPWGFEIRAVDEAQA